MMIAPVADPMCISQGEVAVDGGALPLCMVGDGPPVILLHGWTLDHRMWAPQVDGLAGEFFLVVPDRRGAGRATAPADLAREAEDVIAIADSLGFDRFALVGLSQGAAVALDAARRFGSRLTGVVVSGAPLPALVARDEAIDLDHFSTLAASGDLERLRAEWSRHPLMATQTPDARALMLEILADYDGRDLLARSDLPAFPHEDMAKLAVPVLAMTGAHDTLWRRACAEALAKVAPRAMHAAVPDAGHLANADNPARFNALVASFLTSCADPTKRA
ncbi:MAG: alpha/beta hydrolase [Porphyrobacter sp. IPPAS B-1204]|nr:MAG: alpha/beta hydrolase [Porphyrobacter sp. IPPAS B-1204]